MECIFCFLFNFDNNCSQFKVDEKEASDMAPQDPMRCIREDIFEDFWFMIVLEGEFSPCLDFLCPMVSAV